MLGHLKPHTCSLPSASQRAYKNYYCSICASLRKQNNVSYTFFINNELTLVLLALQPYLGSAPSPNNKALKTRCPALGFTKKNPISLHPSIDLAAQLSVLLGWIKVTDWAYDQPNFFKGLLRKYLNRKTSPLLETLSNDFQQTIENYLRLTQTSAPDFKQLCEQSGELSRQIVLAIGQQSDILPEKLKQIAQLFYHSGIAILLTDHLVDLNKDIEKKQYNPIIDAAQNKRESWNQAYYTVRQQFNHENLKIRDLLTQLLDNKTIHLNFSQALQASLHRMEHQVIKLKPEFIDHQFTFEGVEPVVVTNDCEACGTCCEGAECCVACGEGGCCESCSCSCCSCEGIACCDSCCGDNADGDGGGDVDSGADVTDFSDLGGDSHNKKKKDGDTTENPVG